MSGFRSSSDACGKTTGLRLRRLLAEVEAPESYWLAAQDRLTVAAERRRALACAIVDVMRACYSGLPRTSTKMLAVD
jgi:hypothetical protein